MFRPANEPALHPQEIMLDEAKIIDDLAAMIRCKTVSNRDESLVDHMEFVKFQTLLKERFPTVHRHAKLTKIGKTGLLYHLRGQSAEKPSVCMAHYDVVPAEEKWVGQTRIRRPCGR